jgi:hypothetical protein
LCVGAHAVHTVHHRRGYSVRIPVVVLSLLLASTSSQAGFIANYDQWKRLDQPQRLGVVMGFWDQAATMGDPSNLVDQAQTLGLVDCLASRNLTAPLLLREVEEYYKNDPASREHPAAAVFYDAVVYGLCRRFVNTQRRMRGLKGYQ